MSKKAQAWQDFVNRLDESQFSVLVEAVQARRRRETQEAVRNAPRVSEEEISWRMNGETVRAIKSYRERTGLSLLLSKAAVDFATIPLVLK